jgi:PAS domain S-box-containing protein
MMLLPDFRVRQRDYLLEISRAMTSQLDVGEVLVRILEAAASMLSAQVGLIALLEDDKQTFQARATYGVTIEAIPLFAPLLEQTLVDEGRGLNTELLDQKMIQVARALDMRLRQVIALPMIMHGEVVGVIFLFRAYQSPASLNDQSILQSFADQAAIAVHNARLYERVRQEQLRLAAILEHSADGVLIMDAVGVIQRMNQAAARMTGWQPELAVGLAHDEVVTWKHIDQGAALSAALAGGWPQPVHGENGSEPNHETLYAEGDLLRPDHTLVSVGITYAALVDEHGALKNIVANVRDISNFRQAEQLKSTFISVISHELKTPVALIKGYAGTLRRDDADWDPRTVQDGLTVIEEEADRLTALIENLLAASKLQAEGMRLYQITDVNLAIIAARSAERFQTQTSKHTLKVAFPANFPTIQGDETRLRQVVDNLISNAIKYSPAGGSIRISGSFDDDAVQVSVADKGVGLSKADAARVFERFYRVDDALSRKTQGTGLGLYLARAVIQAHGGTLSVQSELGKGSTFTFSIPREQP